MLHLRVAGVVRAARRHEHGARLLRGLVRRSGLLRGNYRRGFSSLTDRPITSELAQEVLRNVSPEGEAANITIERIQEAVSERFDVSVQELTGHGRPQPISYPRQVAMYLCRELTDSSLPKIGREFGRRDHTTVLYATSKIARLIREKPDVYHLVQDLTRASRAEQIGPRP